MTYATIYNDVLLFNLWSRNGHIEISQIVLVGSCTDPRNYIEKKGKSQTNAKYDIYIIVVFFNPIHLPGSALNR